MKYFQIVQEISEELYEPVKGMIFYDQKKAEMRLEVFRKVHPNKIFKILERKK